GFAAVGGALNAGTQQVVSKNDGGQGDGGSGTKGVEPGAQPSSGAAPATPAPPAGCDLNQVTVSASVDKQAYAAGENPMLSMKVTNGGAVACEVNVGTSQMEFLVMSGSDGTFSAKDCQAASEDLVKT